MSSRPQPSGNETFDQSKPSTDFGTGNLACPGSRAPRVPSRWAISDPGIDVHAATCPGVAEARKAAMVSPDMKSALAASRKDACAASRSELVCGTAATPLEQPRRPVADA